MGKREDAPQMSLQQALERIEALEEQMDNLFANMSLGFFLYEIVPDSTGQDNIRVLIVNQAMADLLRIDKEAVVGKFFDEFWAVEDYRLYMDAALEVAKTGISVGSERYDRYLESYLNFYMYRPKIGQVAVLASDRTDMVKAEENLHKAYQDMSTILSEIPAPICVVRAENGIILSDNHAFLSMCGHEQRENMIGEFIEDYLIFDADMPGSTLKTSIAAESDFVCDLRKVDGEKIQVKIFSRSLKYRNEEAYAIHFINLTKQQSDERTLRAAARAAEEASALKTIFLANMSHEIRTPMNAIKGLAELLALTELNNVQDGYVRNIVKSSNTLLSIINDVLDFSKINEKKIEFIDSPYLLGDLITEVCNVVSLRAVEKGLSLLLEISPSLPKGLIGDDVRVKQVMINLLNNAVKYTPNGYVILRLSGEETENGFELVCAVEDTGIGIKKEEIPFLFEAFSQADRKANRHIQGTGLGLSISDQLTRGMGGRITVESEHGKGSVFTARFPQRVDNSEPLAAVKNPGEKRVLLLERAEWAGRAAHMLDELGVAYVSVTDEAKLPDMDEAGYTHCIYDDSFSDSFIRLIRENMSDCVFVAVKDMRYAMGRSELCDVVLFIPLLITEMAKALSTLPQQQDEDLSDDKTIDDFALSDTQVLVVDDNEINLIVSGEILRAYKAEVTCASSGQEALDLCAESRFDLIFMDHMMPGMDGVDTTIALREGDSLNNTTPIIALTANVVNDMAGYYKQNGMNDFIGKPIELSELRRILLTWLPAVKIVTMTKALMPETPVSERIQTNSMERLIQSLDTFGMYVSDVMREIGNDYDVYIRRMSRIHTELAPLVSRLRDEVRTESWDDFAADIGDMGAMIHDVGARGCAGRARKLASAARERNVNYIRGDFFSLMDNMYMLEKKMEVALPLALGSISPDVPFGDMGYCYDRLMDMRGALLNQDEKTCEALLDSLAHYSLDHDLDLILVGISAKLSARDFSGASDLHAEAFNHCAQILKR